MLNSDLEKGESVIGPVTVVSLNSWESDYFGDPLFAIVSALVARIQQTGKEAGSIISAVKDLGWFATAVGNQVVAKFTGLDAVAAGELVEKKKTQRESQEPINLDAFSVYQARKSAMMNLKDALADFISKSDSRILFLVDELDRCRPDFAIAYLETIKHIFDLPGATFILAADRHHLQNSAKTAFGEELDFDEYYRKFVHREITLPTPDRIGYDRFANSYAQYFLERDDVRSCFLKLDDHRIRNIAELVSALKLTPRQVQECFRVLGHVLSTKTDNRGRLLWCIGVATIAMTAFRIGLPGIFHRIGNQAISPTDTARLLKDDLKLEHWDWWFTLFATGKGMAIENGQTILDVFKDVGLAKKDADDSSFQFGQWHQGWGNSHENRFAQTHQRIEQIMQW
jgi:hypothetical protein